MDIRRAVFRGDPWKGWKERGSDRPSPCVIHNSLSDTTGTQLEKLEISHRFLGT